MCFWQIDGAAEILRTATSQAKIRDRHIAITVKHDALRGSRAWRRQIDCRVTADRGCAPTVERRPGKNERHAGPGNRGIACHVRGAGLAQLSARLIRRWPDRGGNVAG